MTGPRRRILVIGIGAGDPDHLTLAAVKAMRRADVFFVLGKGAEKESLTGLRRDMLDAHVPGPFRVVEAEDPWRDRTRGDRAGYTHAVHDWRRRRADVCERLITEELVPGQCGAFLVWGDPSLYDSTLAILDDVLARGGVDFDHEVIPGITSVSALAARHRVPLNRVGRPVLVTPGRRLAEAVAGAGARADADTGTGAAVEPDAARLPGSGIGADADTVVMLDSHESFRGLTGRGLWIYWGAYLGTPDEILVSGPLDEVAGRIGRVRAEARARHGWIMDTYLLRPPPEPAAG
ncbi:precorrin-6A synthase (deacetylating) [Streptomyces fuscigenes]|uniref:precorrin-6A synthase (deacetylating) n=1 Tax=Streptomyces fuscigenes TaxID=1528880 RepID=UPI001F3394A8|nr:precorrin-6A synthase (deacetylating) [Streptomyces fuscigenes]MCF3962904.1 precorrin-6A synthase (deacetylating) [Streptomyces fuscigenes]